MSNHKEIQHAFFIVNKTLHPNGDLSVDVDDLIETIRKTAKTTVADRAALRMAMLNMRFTYREGRFVITMADFEAMCAKTRDDFVAACQAEKEEA
ncbi:hypothetical protein P3T43_001787 [Paraburkholderia sp. GAS41]|uniref:hypothetical protein n=1 Tax=Paraburkholderia sp. GAS41 TaxID=3035134 RepID=UPI003D2049C1